MFRTQTGIDRGKKEKMGGSTVLRLGHLSVWTHEVGRAIEIPVDPGKSLLGTTLLETPLLHRA